MILGPIEKHKDRRDQEVLPTTKRLIKKLKLGSPGGSVIKSPPANAGDTGLIPDLGGSQYWEQLSPCDMTTATVL